VLLIKPTESKRAPHPKMWGSLLDLYLTCI